jgi:hypothetical protein
MAIANLLSVTVSIAADTMGIFKRKFLVNWVDVFTSRGRTSEYLGTTSTSSNVRPSNKILDEFDDIANNAFSGVVICSAKIINIYQFSLALFA